MFLWNTQLQLSLRQTLGSEWDYCFNRRLLARSVNCHAGSLARICVLSLMRISALWVQGKAQGFGSLFGSFFPYLIYQLFDTVARFLTTIMLSNLLEFYTQERIYTVLIACKFALEFNHESLETSDKIWIPMLKSCFFAERPLLLKRQNKLPWHCGSRSYTPWHSK